VIIGGIAMKVLSMIRRHILWFQHGEILGEKDPSNMQSAEVLPCT